MVERNDPRYSRDDPRFWLMMPEQYADFARHRLWAEETLRGLDTDTRRGVFETEHRFGCGFIALAHLSGDDSANQLASMIGRTAAVQSAMLADPAAPEPNPSLRAADYDTPAPAQDGPGTTWWERQRHNTYQSGRQSLRDDIASLTPDQAQQLLRDIRSPAGPQNNFLDAERRLRAEAGGREARGIGSALADIWVQGRQQGLREWLGQFPIDAPAVSAALSGQLAPGSAPRTAPTATNAAGHRYPSSGADRDPRSR